MRLRQVRSVVDYGKWAQQHGFVVGEGPKPFGPVDPNAHTEGSLHYLGRALDINYRTWEHHRWESEREALTWLYKRTKRFRRFHPRWPLDELFFNGFGFIKEYGVKRNFAIDNHEDHLHIGFMEQRW